MAKENWGHATVLACAPSDAGGCECGCEEMRYDPISTAMYEHMSCTMCHGSAVAVAVLSVVLSLIT